MKKFFTLLMAGIIGIQLCVPLYGRADAGDPCGGAPDRVRTVLSYADGKFLGEDDAFADGQLPPSGFHERVLSKKNSVEEPTSLTYPKGQYGKAADDRSAKLSAYSGNTSLKVGEGESYYAVGSDEVFVVDANVLIPDRVKNHSISFTFGKSYTFGTSVEFDSSGKIIGKHYEVADGTTSTLSEELAAEYQLNQWYRVKIVYVRAEHKAYVFLNGALAGSYPIRENNADLTSVTFSQTSRGSNTDSSSFLIDDVEIYVAESKESASDMTRALANVTSASTSCTVDEQESAVSVSTSDGDFTLDDLNGMLTVTGKVSGVLRDGTLRQSGVVRDGDTLVVLSEDGRTYRYYTMHISLENLLTKATLINDANGNKSTKASYMFDGDLEMEYISYTIGENKEFILDLGAPKEFDQVVVYQSDTDFKPFHLTVSYGDSADGAFTTVFENAYISNINGSSNPKPNEKTVMNFKAVTAQFIKFTVPPYSSIVSTEANKNIAVAEIQLFHANEASKNLLYHRPVLETNVPGAGANSGSVSRMLDGDESTVLKSYTGTAPFAMVLDLGIVRTFDTLKVRTADGNNRVSDVEVWTAAEYKGSETVYTKATETPLRTVTTNNTWLETTFPVQSGRYVKLVFDNYAASQDMRISFAELQLYREGEVTKDFSCQFVPGSGTMEVQADISADNEGALEGMLIGAVYQKDGILLHAKVLDTELEIPPGGTLTKNYSIPVSDETETVRVYFWDSINGMQPVFRCAGSDRTL